MATRTSTQPARLPATRFRAVFRTPDSGATGATTMRRHRECQWAHRGPERVRVLCVCRARIRASIDILCDS